MIILPKGAFVVERDKPAEKEDNLGLILSAEDLKPKLPNTGTIIFTSEELNEYQLCKVVFRENFSEEIDIEKENCFLFFCWL